MSRPLLRLPRLLPMRLAGAGALGVAVLSATLPALAANDGFTDKQRGEIEAIVRDYLVKNPEILIEVSNALQQKQEAAAAVEQKEAIRAQAALLTGGDNQIVLGNPQGDVSLVMFFDYNCGYCRRSAEDIFTLMDKDPKLRVVLKEFPILSEGSVEAARVALGVAAVAPDKYAAFHRALFKINGPADGDSAMKVATSLGLDKAAITAAMQKPEVTETLQQTHELAQALQISGTPSYVVGDTVLPGAVGAAALSQRIEAVRKCGGATSC